MLWVGYSFTIAGTNQTGDTSVNTYLFGCWWQRFYGVIINQQRDKPTSRWFEFDCDCRWATPLRQISRPNAGLCAQSVARRDCLLRRLRQWLFALGKPQITISVFKSRFGKFSRTAITFFLKPRIFGLLTPEVSKCFLQVSQTLLQRYTANLVEKIQIFGFLPTGQKTRSFFVLNSFLSFIPSFGSGSQSFVIDQTHATHCPSQEIFLRLRWVKAISIGTFGHASHYTRLNVKHLIRGRRFLPSAMPRGGNAEEKMMKISYCRGLYLF